MSDVVARLAEIQAQLEAVRAVADEAIGPVSVEDLAAIGEEARGTILDLIRKLFGGWQNIDDEELEAIIAKVTEATALLAAGRYVLGSIAAFAAMRLYLAAIKTPVPGPVV